MSEYDYSKLKGRIRECFSTQSDFAQILEISDTSLSNKLTNKTAFTQDEIKKSIDFFELNPIETMNYFFKEKVDKKSTN